MGREGEQGQTDFTVRDLNWFIDFQGPLETSVRVRYNSGEHPCTVEPGGDGVEQGGTVHVHLKEKTVITPGQSAVFYDGDLVLGGGIIA